MRFLVRLRLGKELEWPEMEVEADDRWGALVKAAEELGLARIVTMGELWRQASIVKKDRSEVRRWRKK